MLTLDLARHGPALPSSPDGDAGRLLSPEGRRLIERLGTRLARDGWNPLPAYVSPLVRARETAELLATTVPGGLPLIVLPELHPEGDPAEVLAVLEPLLEPDSHTLVVGHQPLLGDLVAALTGQGVSVSAGQLIRIHTPEPLARGRGTIVATFQPPAYA